MHFILYQEQISSDVGINVSTVEKRIQDLGTSKGSTLMVFPEFMLTGPPESKDQLSLLQPEAIQHAVLHLHGLIRQKSSLAAIVPTLYYDNGKWFSSALIFKSDSGDILRHDKTVLTPSESLLLHSGEQVRPFIVHDRKIGVLLCSEGNGSELIAALSMYGAELLVHSSYPDSKPGSASSKQVSVWDMSMISLYPVRSRIRAFGEQLYYASVMPAGSGSRSRVVDPFGTLIAQGSSYDTEVIAIALDFESFPLRRTPSFLRRQQVFWSTVRMMQNDLKNQAFGMDSAAGG